MENTLFAIYMTSYYDYVFGFSTDIYELLEKGYGYYNNLEFIQLLKQARKERDALKVENDQLKKEIATMNGNIVASLERDLMHMRAQVNKAIKPTFVKIRTVEDLDP
jgi:cell division protein FtsB